MKATEAFNEVGMVCRSDDGWTGVLDSGDLVSLMHRNGDTNDLRLIDVADDDWTRVGNIRDLLPPIDLSDISKVEHYYAVHDPEVLNRHNGHVGPHEAVLVSDLRKHVPTRDSEEVERLKERLAEVVEESNMHYGNFKELAEVNLELRKNVVTLTADNDNLQLEVSKLNTENGHLEADCKELQSRVAELEGQLPEGMKHCTIKFLECEKGHGRLTAGNWVQRDCWVCVNEALAAEVKSLAKEGDELREGYETILEHCGIQNNVVEYIKGLKAELAILREQCVLGEPLTEEEYKNLGGYEQLIVGRGSEWQATPKKHCALWETLEKWEWRAYLDPRPFPVLPAPEPSVPEVPAVPKWLGAVTYQSMDGEKIGFVTRVAPNGIDIVCSCHSHTYDDNSPAEFTIYRGPVRHPDGTIAPIEPTAELLAALKGGESQ